MKAAIIILLVVAVASAKKYKGPSKFQDHAKVVPSDDSKNDIKNFKSIFGVDDNDNKDERDANILKCRDQANEHDADAHGYSLGMSSRCGMTAAEKAKGKNKHLALAKHKQRKSDSSFSAGLNHVSRGVAPASMDWRTVGAVSPVKDQGYCGSCYSFAAAAALEGAYFRKYGVLLNVSTQQYVDCSSGYTLWFIWSSAANDWVPASSIVYSAGNGNNGCDGGLYQQCWGYNQLKTNQNLWSCYSYNSGTTEMAGSCSSKSCGTQVKVTGYVNINNEADLLNAVGTIGPVACSLDADTLDSYTGGIFNGNGCSTSSNHAITVVGYGTDATYGDYWIVKNSWGVYWGEKGYFRIKRGSNTCGIGSNYCAYPIVA